MKRRHVHLGLSSPVSKLQATVTLMLCWQRPITCPLCSLVASFAAVEMCWCKGQLWYLQPLIVRFFCSYFHGFFVIVVLSQPASDKNFLFHPATAVLVRVPSEVFPLRSYLIPKSEDMSKKNCTTVREFWMRPLWHQSLEMWQDMPREPLACFILLPITFYQENECFFHWTARWVCYWEVRSIIA